MVCCAFYLAWWLMAFKTNPIKGMKTGWLLIPAFAADIAAVVMAGIDLVLLNGSLSNRFS